MQYRYTLRSEWKQLRVPFLSPLFPLFRTRSRSFRSIFPPFLSLPPDSLGRPLTSTRRPTSSVSFGRGRERGGKTSLHGAERETGRKIGIAILLARMKKCKRQLNILLICLCRVRTSVVHSPPGNPFCPREPLEREREERKESKREWRSNNFSTSSFPSFPKPGIERNRIAATFLSRLSFN